MVRTVLLKGGILCFVTYAFIRMWHWKIGFTYFTQLSNAYVFLIVLCQLVTGHRFLLWKYTGTVSIVVTFLVFLTVLGPVMPGGLLGAYAQDHYASLCLHLLVPVLTLADFLGNDLGLFPGAGGADPSFLLAIGSFWRPVFVSLVPPLAYLALILALGKGGVRWGHGTMAAPYLFLNYEAPAGWFGFAPETASFTTLGIGVFYMILVLLALFLGVGAGLLWLVRRLSLG